MQAEKVVDMQEYKHIKKKKELYTYQDAVYLAYSIVAREKRARKEKFWDEMFVAVPMASVFIVLWFALLMGF